MNLMFLTPGTGNYYCGVCMRDNALVAALRKEGHEAIMLPMYLPVVTDESAVADEMPIFFGGINVYLQQKFALFRHTPGWLDNMLNHRGLLRLAGGRSAMTQGADLGALSVSMLQGESGKQAKEVTKLIGWLQRQNRPDVVLLSTALQAGVARSIKDAMGIPVVCFLQGEDGFLDALAAPYAERAWATLRNRMQDMDAIIAPSAFFAGLMGQRLAIAPESIQVIPNGINLEGFEPRGNPPDPPVIGYLARLMEAKGLGVLVDAFILLKERGRFPSCRLKIGGATTTRDRAYVRLQCAKLASEGIESDVSWHLNLERDQKIDFLRSLTLFSVPATYDEAFGLYLIEALAAGVPAVQPDRAAFSELVRDTGGGTLYNPNNAASLADAWEALLDDSQRIQELSERGCAAVGNRYTIAKMARCLVATLEGIRPCTGG